MNQFNLLVVFVFTYLLSLVLSSPITTRKDLSPIFLSKDEYDKLLQGIDLNDIINQKTQQQQEAQEVDAEPAQVLVRDGETTIKPIVVDSSEYTTVRIGSATVAGESEGFIGGVQRVANGVKRFVARLFTLYEDENRKVIVIPLFFPTVIG